MEATTTMQAQDRELSKAGRPRRILLATDLSFRCDRAQDRASRLAQQWQAKLCLLHVTEGDERGNSGPSWRRGTSSRELLAERQRRAAARGGAVEVEVLLRRGNPAEVILQTAEDMECDVIVTGIAREETLTRSILGTTVERLVHRAPMPVLVVKNRAERDYDSVVAASDFSPSSAHAFRHALRMFPEARITLLHAYRVPFEGFVSRDANRDEVLALAEGQCAGFLASLDAPKEQLGRIECLLEYGSPDELIGSHVWDKEVDLVVLGTHGMSGVFGILMGSTAERLLRSLPCDVLVVREPRSLPAAGSASVS
jgi:nucleotide-binding universal stress UspA family protein